MERRPKKKRCDNRKRYDLRQRSSCVSQEALDLRYRIGSYSKKSSFTSNHLSTTKTSSSISEETLDLRHKIDGRAQTSSSRNGFNATETILRIEETTTKSIETRVEEDINYSCVRLNTCVPGENYGNESFESVEFKLDSHKFDYNEENVNRRNVAAESKTCRLKRNFKDEGIESTGMGSKRNRFKHLTEDNIDIIPGSHDDPNEVPAKRPRTNSAITACDISMSETIKQNLTKKKDKGMVSLGEGKRRYQEQGSHDLKKRQIVNNADIDFNSIGKEDMESIKHNVPSVGNNGVTKNIKYTNENSSRKYNDPRSTCSSSSDAGASCEKVRNDHSADKNLHSTRVPVSNVSDISKGSHRPRDRKKSNHDSYNRHQYCKNKRRSKSKMSSDHHKIKEKEHNFDNGFDKRRMTDSRRCYTPPLISSKSRYLNTTRFQRTNSRIDQTRKQHRNEIPYHSDKYSSQSNIFPPLGERRKSIGKPTLSKEKHGRIKSTETYGNRNNAICIQPYNQVNVLPSHYHSMTNVEETVKRREKFELDSRRRCASRNKHLCIEDEFDSILKKSPDEVAVFIGTNSEDLEHYLWKNKNHKNINILVQVLHKVCQSDRTENKRKALYVLKEERFFNRKDVTSPISTAILNRKIDQDICNYLISLVKIAIASVELVAAEITDMAQFISSIEGTTKYLEDSKHVESELERLRQKLQNQTEAENNLEIATQMTDEENNIKNENILPSIHEIRNNVAFNLEKRKNKKAFNNPLEYLRHIFILFREDFIRPLKKGMRKYIEHMENPETKGSRFRDDDIRIFENVKILNTRCSTEDGIIWTIQFDVSRYKRVNWNARSLLQYGALVCLSCDGFNTIYYATIANRMPNDLRRGIVEVAFVNSTLDTILTRIDRKYIMIECKASYSSYASTLNAIQEMSEKVQEGERFPFSRYLVYMDRDVNHPNYFNHQDFLKNLVTLDCISDFEQFCQRNVNILDHFDVPDAESLGVDVSQHNALFLGLTNELALIQGPPGTGKTVIGLKIANVLLNNEYLWRGYEENQAPMIILSYTNHALDQFLDEILNMQVMRNCDEQDLVRVGSRTDSENLMKYNLSKRRREFITKNAATHRARNKLLQRQRKHEKLGRYIEIATSGILHEQYLFEIGVISSQQFGSLKSREWILAKYLPDNGTLLTEWLCILSTEFESYVETLTKRTKTEIKPSNLKPDECILLDDEENNNMYERETDSEDEYATFEDECNRLYGRKYSETKLESVEPYAAVSESLLFPDSGEDTRQNGQYNYNQRNLSYWGNFDEKHRKDILRNIGNMINIDERMSYDEVLKVGNVWLLHLFDRWRLYRYWLHLLVKQLKETKHEYEKSYERAQKRYKEARVVSDVQILKRAKVVGMTTTRAARDIELLRKIGSNIMILEEAAEIPEHHVIACITNSCKHLIMIGDHQQLRPAYNDYDLSKEFNTNISLFERLIQGNLPFSQLQFQHRMRPEIAQLLTPHIYRRLRNHPSVLNRRNVRGIDKNIFFIFHTEQESIEQEAESKSHMNQHEATFLCELYRYLRIQGYHSREITILTTYKDQMREIRKRVREMETGDTLLSLNEYETDEVIDGSESKGFLVQNKEKKGTNDEVRVTVVDNFQGEENKIILLSLVRSNMEECIGYLREANRVCVALSRAKEGLYVMGNFAMLEKKSVLWKRIIDDARRRGKVGSALHLCCQNHPDNHTAVSKSKDFKKVNDGGCNLQCRFQRKCGHVCDRLCHPDDQKHLRRCNKDCRKILCKRNHRCMKRCHETCGTCKEKVKIILPRCDHEQEVICSVDPKDVDCKTRCEIKLSCGHRCQKYCGQPCTTTDDCNELEKVKAKCGHELQVACCKTKNPICKVPCLETLSCGHICKGSCSACSEKRLHQPCKFNCEKTQVCGHICKEKCILPCPTCKENCYIKCSHRDCQDKCGIPCIRCIEPCEWSCCKGCPNRYACNKLCLEPCDRPRCNIPCTRRLPCNHTCPGLLCEECPDKCLICNKEELQEIFFGYEEDVGARFIQLEDCKCVFEVQGLDYFMDSEDSGCSKTITVKRCPRCRTMIRFSKRYGNVLKSQRGDVESVNREIEKQEYGRFDQLKEELIRKREEISPLLVYTEENKKHRNVLHTISMESIKKVRTKRELDLKQNILNFLSNINSVREQIARLDEEEPVVMKPGKFLKTKMLSLFRWVMENRTQFSEQELSEFEVEMTRTSVLMDYVMLLGDIRKQQSTDDIDSVNTFTLETIAKLESITEIKMEELETLQNRFECLRQKVPESGIGISKREQIMVIKAMDLAVSGHWYKCKNGHFYAIGECGGAMVQTKCPYCDVMIGGAHHELNEDNFRATEMEIPLDE